MAVLDAQRDNTTSLGAVVETDVPARMDRLPWGRFHTLVVAALGITWILDGLEVTLVGAVAGALKQSPVLQLSSTDIGLAASAYLTGAVLGALFFGWLTDRIGRKKLFFATLTVYLIATAATAFSWNFWSFIAFRFLTGAGIGGEYAAINSTIQALIAAPLEFSNYVGMPLRDALAFVDDTLNGFALRRHIRVIASGKVSSGFEIVKNLSLGADMCNCARAMMLALGCIQALECNHNTCPTGVATQDPNLMKGLDVADKKVRVKNFHNETVKSAAELMAAAGIDHPRKILRSFIYRRISASQIQTYSEMYPNMLRGALLEAPFPQGWELDMMHSSENTFDASIN